MFGWIEDAPQTVFLGARVYTWGLYCFFGAVLCLVTVYFQTRGKTNAAPLFGVIALPLGLVLARLFYCLFDARMRVFEDLADGSLEWGEYLGMLADIRSGGFGMFGALLGGVLAALIVSRALGEDRMRLLDAAVCGLMLFVAAERLGEGSLEDFGVSRPLSERTGWWGLFITHGEFDDCISTYMLESLTALGLFILLEWRRSSWKRGDAFLMGTLLFGLTQVLMESLRFDQHMRFSFVSVQQVLAMCCAAFALFVYGRRLKRLRIPSRLPLVTAVMVPAAVGLIVGLEFMIDRSGVSRVLLYMIYIAALAGLGFAGARMRRLADGKGGA